jgi:hypothetical protein
VWLCAYPFILLSIISGSCAFGLMLGGALAAGRESEPFNPMGTELDPRLAVKRVPVDPNTVEAEGC